MMRATVARFARTRAIYRYSLVDGKLPLERGGQVSLGTERFKKSDTRSGKDTVT